MHNFCRGKKISTKRLAPSVILKKMAKESNSPTSENLPNLATLLLGSMLLSQFSAIFDNFQRKNWRFSQKPML
jgi:hypothetical protein